MAFIPNWLSEIVDNLAIAPKHLLDNFNRLGAAMEFLSRGCIGFNIRDTVPLTSSFITTEIPTLQPFKIQSWQLASGSGLSGLAAGTITSIIIEYRLWDSPTWVPMNTGFPITITGATFASGVTTSWPVTTVPASAQVRANLQGVSTQGCLLTLIGQKQLPNFDPIV